MTFDTVTKDPWFIALVMCLGFDSLRPYGARASIPALGRAPTILTGPPEGEGLFESFSKKK